MDKTAEDINPKKWMKDNYFDEEDGKWLKFDDYGSMQEYAEFYHETKLKEELMHFVDYTNMGYDHEKWDKFIDKYLKQRNNGTI